MKRTVVKKYYFYDIIYRGDNMSYFKTSDNVNIYYEINGEGIPIIFIHGFSESGDIFRIQKRVLSKLYKIITYDIRGHGKSDKVEYGLNIDRASLDLKELIEHLGLNKVMVVAWSMGASVLFQYIDKFDTEKLQKIIIVDKSPKMINDVDWDLGLYHGKYNIENWKEDLSLLRNDFDKFTKKFTENMSPNLSEREFEIASAKLEKNSPKVLYEFWKSMGENDYRDTLKKIDIETLIVFGGKSRLYSIHAGEYLKKNTRKSKLEIFYKNGHLLVLENPRRFNKVLEDFISNS